MTKTLLIVNKSLLLTGKNPRGTRWQLSQNQYRGHPMVSRRGGQIDYFRRCMARYYGWKAGSNPSNYSDFGYLATHEDLPLANQGSLDYNVAFGIENAQSLLQSVYGDNDDPFLPLNDVIDYINTGEGPNAMAMLFGYPHRATTTWGPSNPLLVSSAGEESSHLQLEAAVAAWLNVSNTEGITNFARHLDSQSDNTDTDLWWNWQAYVLGDGALDFDGSARKFPGIFGPGMQSVRFVDHAFERDLPGPVGISMVYNYSNSFFDSIGSNPYVDELLIPNFYLLGSVLSNGDGGIAYDNLFTRYNQPTTAAWWYNGMLDRNEVKSILGLTLGPTVGGTAANPATDIVAPGAAGSGMTIPLAQVPASNQVPNSLLSRFTRCNFSDQDPAKIEERSQARDINRHVGLPHRMLAGGANSIVKSMNGHANKYPYAIVVDLTTLTDSTDAFIESMERTQPQGPVETLSEVTSNFFLYEVMKANILNFSNHTGSQDPYYEDLDLSAMLTERSDEGTEKKYYGFSSTSTTPAWAQGPEALQPYSLRAIDLRNLFRSLFQYSLDINNPPSEEDPDYYSGIAGQNIVDRVAMGKGIIAGARFFHSGVSTPIRPRINSEKPRNGLDGDNFADFFIQMSDFMNENTRNFANMVLGAKAYRNTLVYKLDKHTVTSGGQPSAEPIQSIYFARVEGVHKYTDTQVLFGKKYIYKLYAYDLVLGNDYKYESAEVFPPIEDYYPNPLTSQLHGFNFNIHGWSDDWNLTSDGVYIGTPIQRMAQLSQGGVGLLYWQNGRIMPHIDLSDGLDLDEGTEVGGFPSYADIKINGTYLEAPLPLLSVSGVALDADGLPNDTVWSAYESEYVQGMENAINGVIDDYFNENPQFNNTERYLSKVRVRSISRSMLDESGVNQATRSQILIAQVGQLVVDPAFGSGPQGSIVEMIRDIGGSDPNSIFPASVNPFAAPMPGQPSLFEDYFNLVAATLLGDEANWGVGDPLDLSLLFRTGQHGIEPQIPWNLNDAGSATAIVKNYKSPKIIEIPIGQTNAVLVSDLPPQFPDVDIFPLKGSSRQIKILLNSNFTKAAYVPVIIEPTDVDIFDNVAINQDRQPGEPVVFRSDDPAVSYQVFRTLDKPSSYQDFSDKLHFTVDALTPSGKPAESTSFLDTVDSNVYYYYCFRTIDKNGYISNPTPVLRVQMVDDNGRIYPIIEPHNFDLSEPRKTEKSFKRYIEIDTSIHEKVLTHAAVNSAGDPSVAPTGLSVGSPNGVYDSNTTYKVRIISKDTGRKIDLNLNFNVETIPNPNLPGN